MTWLSPDQVAELTGTAPRSFKAQRKRLQEMGIPVTPAFTGRPLGDPETLAHNSKPRRKVLAPDWSALDAKAANRK
jgi:hypothetical protein